MDQKLIEGLVKFGAILFAIAVAIWVAAMASVIAIYALGLAGIWLVRSRRSVIPYRGMGPLLGYAVLWGGFLLIAAWMGAILSAMAFGPAPTPAHFSPLIFFFQIVFVVIFANRVMLLRDYFGPAVAPLSLLAGSLVFQTGSVLSEALSLNATLGMVAETVLARYRDLFDQGWSFLAAMRLDAEAAFRTLGNTIVAAVSATKGNPFLIVDTIYPALFTALFVLRAPIDLARGFWGKRGGREGSPFGDEAFGWEGLRWASIPILAGAAAASYGIYLFRIAAEPNPIVHFVLIFCVAWVGLLLFWYCIRR
jgi:hypothetical protein